MAQSSESEPTIRRERKGLSPVDRGQLKSKLQPLYDETSATDICLTLALLIEEDGNRSGAENLRRFVLPM